MIVTAIKAAARAAERHKKAEKIVRKLFEERYGFDFSDIDCDPLIDICSGQGIPFKNIKELDDAVFQYNDLKPIKKRSR